MGAVKQRFLRLAFGFGLIALLAFWFWPAVEIPTLPKHLIPKQDRLDGKCLMPLKPHFAGSMRDPGGQDWDQQLLFHLSPGIPYQIRERPRLLLFLVLAHRQRLASRFQVGSELRFNLGSWPFPHDLEVWWACSEK
ncbi:hypothetical protein COW20_14060 [bacterium (Candidatus Blackallbacteria) CG13_big_fil_rev_8_21_14_2_50_49_14]|nr:MAG: hypothetical protein COW20_14060 [bacterium (Candidatus Blackallbacteria) CG13_big_fil_rev_8_21_14_2_50_49_14]